MTSIREQTMLSHEEISIDRFLRRLDADLQWSRQVRGLPEELAQAMLVTLGQASSPDEEIEGEVAL